MFMIAVWLLKYFNNILNKLHKLERHNVLCLISHKTVNDVICEYKNVSGDRNVTNEAIR